MHGQVSLGTCHTHFHTLRSLSSRRGSGIKIVVSQFSVTETRWDRSGRPPPLTSFGSDLLGVRTPVDASPVVPVSPFLTLRDVPDTGRVDPSNLST